MLILTRKVGQTIRIGDDIVISVLANRPAFGREVTTIGISAPSDIVILRGELVEPEGDDDEG